MVKRLLVVGLIASVLMVTRAGEASACSCMAMQPSTALGEFDAAFVGRLVDRPALEMPFTESAPYRFEVETWIKGDLGSELVVHAPNQGSACGFEAPVGERVGVLVHVDENGTVRGNLCTTVNADLLLAGDRPLALDGSGAPVFVVAGFEGPARLMLLDGSGGLLVSVGGDDETLNGLALCPGKKRLVEMVNDQLVVRSTDDLAEVRRIDLHGLPNEMWVSHVWCRDETGETLWLAAESWTEADGPVYRLLDVDNVDLPILEGGYGWLELGDEVAVAGEGSTAATIWRIDLESGERALLHQIPIEPGDSEPSGRGWVDPSGERVLISQWRYRDDTGGKTTFFLYELGSGELLGQSEALPTADALGWADENLFHISSYPDLMSDDVNHFLLDTDRFELSPIEEAPGWQVLRVGDHLAGVMAAHLRIVSVDGGEVVDLRLLPSETHHLVSVLQPEATVTPTTAPTGTVEPGASTPADDIQEMRVSPASMLAAAMVVLALALGAVWYRRRA